MLPPAHLNFLVSGFAQEQAKVTLWQRSHMACGVSNAQKAKHQVIAEKVSIRAQKLQPLILSKCLHARPLHMSFEWNFQMRKLYPSYKNIFALSKFLQEVFNWQQ